VPIRKKADPLTGETRSSKAAGGAPDDPKEKDGASPKARKPKAIAKPKTGKSQAGRAKLAGQSQATGRSQAAGKGESGGGHKIPARPKGVASASAAAPARHSAQAVEQRAALLKTVVIDALDDMKALEVKVLDVRGLTDVADIMVIASGTSDRHVRSVAQKVVEKTKAAGFRPHGVEGQQDSDWVLIDLHEMIVHVMLPRVREFYGLEKLWDMTVTKRVARA